MGEEDSGQEKVAYLSPPHGFTVEVKVEWGISWFISVLSTFYTGVSPTKFNDPRCWRPGWGKCPASPCLAGVWGTWYSCTLQQSTDVWKARWTVATVLDSPSYKHPTNPLPVLPPIYPPSPCPHPPSHRFPRPSLIGPHGSHGTERQWEEVVLHVAWGCRQSRGLAA